MFSGHFKKILVYGWKMTKKINLGCRACNSHVGRLRSRFCRMEKQYLCLSSLVLHINEWMRMENLCMWCGHPPLQHS